MDKSEFLERLNTGLRSLPEDETREIMADYEEHFAAGREAGRTEAEISASLGDPEKLGKQLLSVSLIETAEKTGSISALCRAALAIVGLGLFNFIIALVPITIAASLILAIVLCGLAFTFGGIGALFITILSLFITPDMTLVTPSYSPLSSIALYTGITTSGLLICIGSMYLASLFVRAMARYFRMNLSVVRRAYGNEI